MEITGKLVKIFKEKKISESFSKREFVVEYAENPQYPELIKLEVIKDKCKLLNSFQEGQEIKVQINIKGRKWNDKEGVDVYFNTLQAWKIENTGEVSQPQTKSKEDISNFEAAAPIEEDDSQDLPF